MKVKVDENLPRSLSEQLRAHGHDSDSVIEEGLAGSRDEVVADAIRREQRLLITLDRGFGDIRDYPPGSHAGIIVLRPVEQKTRQIKELIQMFLMKRTLDEVAGCIVVVAPDSVRIRRPQA